MAQACLDILRQITHQQPDAKHISSVQLDGTHQNYCYHWGDEKFLVKILRPHAGELFSWDSHWRLQSLLAVHGIAPNVYYFDQNIWAFLDPVADKLLVTVALILLMHRMDNIFITLAGMVVIGREIVISALREWMAQLGKRASMAVSGIAKVKTGVQMTAIPILIWYPSWPAIEEIRLLGLFLLALAVILTLWSMVLYFRAFLSTLEEESADADESAS